MNRTSVLYTLFLMALAFIHLQNSNGAAAVQEADRTGSPLSTANCGACHGGGNFSPSLEASLLDEGMPVNSYTPGKDYTVRLSIAAANNPSAYGFQAVALKAADNTNAGTFKSPPTGFRVINLNNRLYAEHSSRRTSPIVEIPWTAPAAGTGTVRLYAAGIAANANNGISGDNTAGLTSPLELTEAVVTSTHSPNTPANMDIFPNPTSGDWLYVRPWDSAEQIHIQIFSLQGQRVYSHTESSFVKGSIISIPLANLPKGVYQLHLRTPNTTGNQRFIVH